MFKRIITAILSLALFVGAFSGCTTTKTSNGENVKVNKDKMPIVDEKITMRMLCPVTAQHSDPNTEMGLFTEMEKITNIKMEVDAVPYTSFPEKKKLLFASGDLPDLVFGADLSAQEEYSYGSQGLLIPLQDLIKEYAPGINEAFNVYPNARKQVTLPTGDIVSLPLINDETKAGIGARYYINDKWLKQLGLGIPKNPDELYTALKAFKEKDPNGNGITDEMPMSMFLGLGWFKRFVYNWGINTMGDKAMYVDDNKTVKYAFIQDETREAFKFYSKLYQDDLIDKEFVTMAPEQFNAKSQTDPNVVGSFFYIAPEQAFGLNFDRALEYKNVAPFKAANGKQIYPATDIIMRGRAGITNVCKNPQAAIRWLDYFYTPEGQLVADFGEDGGLYTRQPDGTIEFKNDETNGGGEELRAKHTLAAGVYLPGRVFTENPKYKIEEKDEGRKKLRALMESSHNELLPLKNVAFPQLYFDVDKQKRADLLYTDVERYIDSSLIKFITEPGLIDSQWDTYVKKVKEMGVDELTQMYQATYDKYLKN